MKKIFLSLILSLLIIFPAYGDTEILKFHGTSDEGVKGITKDG